MKSKGYVLLAAALMVSLAAGDALAQRRGGGRGGRSGINRPAASRPSPAKPAAKAPAAKAPAGKLPSGKLPSGKLPSGVRSGAAGRPSAADLQQFLSLPGQRPGTLPGPGQPPGPRGNRPAIGSGNLGSGNTLNVNRAQINKQVNARYATAAHWPFTQNWWAGWPGHLAPRPWHPWYRPGWAWGPNYWWRWATPAALTAWVVYGWATPVYYTYGTGGNVYYQDETVYVDGQPYASSAEYYQQAESIAESVPELNDEQAKQVEWLPLGVFAMTKEGVDQTNFLLQLAVSKEGILSGALTNQESGSVRPVEGTVDKQTQRAVWKFVGEDDRQTEVVMETSVYNLTKDQCTALVHFGPDRTETAVLVRLDPPAEK